MTEPVRRTSVLRLANLILAGYVALAGWLFHWQIIEHERFRGLAAANRKLRSSMPARRGTITDSQGTVLAASDPVKTVCVDPVRALLPPELDFCRREAALTIAHHLDLDPEVVLEKTKPSWFDRNGRQVAVRYRVLKHKVALESWNRLTNDLASLKFAVDRAAIAPTNRFTLDYLPRMLVFSEDDYFRRYPCQDLAPHVLGFVRSVQTNRPAGPVFEDQGRHGLELMLNKALQGPSGWRMGNERVEPRAGLNVVVTIDSTIQRIVEDHLRRLVREQSAHGAVAVVIRPRTGDILALSSLPDFNPSSPTNVLAHKNLVISEMLEPGSTLKAMTFAEAVERKLFSWDESVFCENGQWRVQNTTIKDFHPQGELTYREVLMKSSNIGTAKLAWYRLPYEQMREALFRFGFGVPTGILLPNEAAGIVNRPQQPTDYLRIVFGQFVSTTPLQMAMAYSALANDGLLMRPRLVERIEDEDGQVLVKFPPLPIRQVVSAETATNLTHALVSVVGPGGTGQKARLDRYTVAGKTGTAQMYDTELKTYPNGKDYPSLVGYLPASRPEVCILIGLIEPRSPGRHGGGAVVGPTWKRVAEQVANYLRLPTDLELDSDLRPPGMLDSTWPVGPIAASGSASTAGRVYR